MTNLTPPAASAVQDEVPGVVASAARINGWAEIAKPGDRFVYAARSSMLPRGSEGGRAARDLIERGVVRHEQKRVGPNVITYSLIRTGRPWSTSRVERPVPQVATVTSESAAIDALYRVLLRHARFGRPCPTDAKLAVTAKIDLASVQPALAAMVETGLIKIKGVKAPTLRIISIVTTGHATGIIG